MLVEHLRRRNIPSTGTAPPCQSHSSSTNRPDMRAQAISRDSHIDYLFVIMTFVALGHMDYAFTYVFDIKQ